MLEKMGAFFDARLDGYEEHQLTCIAGAPEFYSQTAAALPQTKDAALLDLGCGTGLELNAYFAENPTARLTGIDLAEGMLQTLREKFPQQQLTLICGSYFTQPFGEEVYDAAVSVESLHHFTKAEKIPLYQRLHAALKPDGYFILTDYFAADEKEEQALRAKYLSLRKAEGISDGDFYHFDTPLTVEHEIEAPKAGGFSDIRILNRWETTALIKAMK